MPVSRRTLIGGLLAGAGALACRSRGALGDPLPDRSWYARIPRAAFGAGGLAHLGPTRLRVYDPQSGAVLIERPLTQGLALTTLADGSFLAMDRVAAGLRMLHLGPGVDETLEPPQTGALSSDVGALLPHPGDAARFRVLDRAQRVVRQASLSLVAGRLALDAVLTLPRSLPGPLIVDADASLLWFEAGALHRQAVRAGATAEKLAWSGAPLVRLARGPTPGQVWGADGQGRISLIAPGAAAGVLRALDARLAVEDLDAGPGGLAVLGRALPGGASDPRALTLLSLDGQERARWTVDASGEPSVLLGAGDRLALEKSNFIYIYKSGETTPQPLGGA